jgi:hypothetical protein
MTKALVGVVSACSVGSVRARKFDRTSVFFSDWVTEIVSVNNGVVLVGIPATGPPTSAVPLTVGA